MDTVGASATGARGESGERERHTERRESGIPLARETDKGNAAVGASVAMLVRDSAAAARLQRIRGALGPGLARPLGGSGLWSLGPNRGANRQTGPKWSCRQSPWQSHRREPPALGLEAPGGTATRTECTAPKPPVGMVGTHVTPPNPAVQKFVGSLTSARASGSERNAYGVPGGAQWTVGRTLSSSSSSDLSPASAITVRQYSSI